MPGVGARRSEADVVVVGCGVTGAATARALAAEGRDVRILERFAVGHAHGSSHGTSRIFRISYPDERYVRLAQASLREWRAVEAKHGHELLRTTGSLDLGGYAETNRRALSACGARFEMLDGRAASARWPLDLAAEERALHQPDGGILLADRAWRALADSAVANGAVLEEGVAATAIADRGRTVTVETSARTYSARCVVVSAGAWAAPLLAGAGITLPVVPTRETVAHFRLEPPGSLPCVIDDATPPTGDDAARAGALTYALGSPGIGVKVGLHHSGPVADPDAEAPPDPDVVGRAAAWIARRIPTADPDPVLVETCLYTNTADENFVLERHGRVVVASACSGHAFKFAPSLGRTVAALASQAL
jgi:sarcosine oxidase